MTSNTDDSFVCQTDVKQKFIISSISQLISDSNDLVFTKLLSIECIKCQKRFDNLLDNYNHFLDTHKVNENVIEINDMSERVAKRVAKNSTKLKPKKSIIQLPKGVSENGHKKETEVKTSDKPFVCDFFHCEKTFSTNKLLKKHMKIHTRVKSKDHICDFKGCTKAYWDREGLLKHIRIHSDPILCDICGKGFGNRTSLRSHIVVHSDDKPLSCNWPGCEYRGKLKGQVDAHMITHTKAKPFRCDFDGCAQSFSGCSVLKQHKNRVHYKIKNIQCNWPGCESVFFNNRELKCHMLVHTNERRHPCDWPDCDKRFTTADILRKHRRTHTGERPYHCTIDGCTASFSCPGTLGTHKKLIHKCNEIVRSRWDRPKKTGVK